MPVIQNADPVRQSVARILSIPVPLIVKLADRRIGLEEVLRLSVGSIIEFRKSSDEQLELMINNKAIGVGYAVKVGENFGIRLTHIGDVRELLDAMSPPPT
jgi:flagellar motor switch protein FliN/FliY